MDQHQFHTYSCILLPDGVYLAHEFNGNGRTFVRHILDFFQITGYIESAEYGLFYEVSWNLLFFSLFMALTYLEVIIRKSGTRKIQMVLAVLATIYEINIKCLEIRKDIRLSCGILLLINEIYIIILMNNKILLSISERIWNNILLSLGFSIFGTMFILSYGIIRTIICYILYNEKKFQDFFL